MLFFLLLLTKSSPPLCMLSLFPLQRVTIDYVIIFCRKHKIVRELETPERNHIIFPKMPEGAPMEQDVREDEGAPMEKDVPEEIEQPSSTEQTRMPPPAASDQNQCSCSSPFISFAPSSLFTQPYPGSCGWLDEDD